MFARLHRDDGSILPLIAFFAAFTLALILVVVGATSLYLERKRLLTLADGAALVGAEAFELDDVEPGAGRLSLTLSDESVRSAVEVYLAPPVVEGFEGLRLERAESVDGRSATVALSAYWRPPVLTIVLPEDLRIDVESTARSVFG